MKRFYEGIIADHFKNAKQMAFVCGPRQVGKTTIAKALMGPSKQSSYRNWDISEDRIKIAANSFKPLPFRLSLTCPLMKKQASGC